MKTLIISAAIAVLLAVSGCATWSTSSVEPAATATTPAAPESGLGFSGCEIARSGGGRLWGLQGRSASARSGHCGAPRRHRAETMGCAARAGAMGGHRMNRHSGPNVGYAPVSGRSGETL